MVGKIIQTLHNGKAPVHEKYIKEAVKKREGLAIMYKGKQMSIKWDDVEKRIAYWGNPFKDKFSSKYYKLAYYNWVPDGEEEKKVVQDNPQMKLL
jgi:hypothetical protein